MSDPDYRSEAYLRQRYHGDGCSLQEIADDCGVVKSTIQHWMDTHDIDRRSLADAHWKDRPTSPVGWRTVMDIQTHGGSGDDVLLQRDDQGELVLADGRRRHLRLGNDEAALLVAKCIEVAVQDDTRGLEVTDVEPADDEALADGGVE